MMCRLRRIAIPLVLMIASAAHAQSVGAFGIDANYGSSMSAAGKTWTQDRHAVEPFAAFAKAGCTAARIRVWVGDDGTNRLNEAVDTARRAQAAGFRPYVVLFLSEDWADYVKQPAPKIWQGLSDADKAVAIEAYAERAAKRFADAGIAVDTFEIGNEIDFGICGVFEEAWPNRISLDYMQAKIWPRMVPLIAAAQKGVSKVTPDAKFVLHLTQWNNPTYCIAFWQFMMAAGVKLDYAGLSYFPSSATDANQRSFDFLRTHIAMIHDAVKRPVQICEIGYPAATQFGGRFADWNKPADAYPLTEAGQAKWTTNLVAFIHSEPRLAGAFYWSPEWYGGGL